MSHVLERLRAALAESYRIDRELGRGGMATVFLAQDLRHHRSVAIKVLDPELAALLGRDRFLFEIETAARLQHPHILPLLDSGATDGLLYYVMPYVEGESLRERLNRERQLPVDDALRLSGEIAGALDDAHHHGIVHRDIKPENILLSGGQAVVADFGIARAIHAAGGQKVTTKGTVLGTPLYLSPEQAMGSPDLDGRSDIYSLACVLYEMLAGQPPFTGPVDSVVHQHMSMEPRPVTAWRPAVPAAVGQALTKALAKAPADRFSTAGQFAEALSTSPSPAKQGGLVPTSSRWRTWLGRNRWSPWAAGGLGIAAVLVLTVLFLKPPFEREVSEASVYYERGLHYLREEAETLQSLDDAIHMFYRALSADSSSALAWAGLGEAYWTRYDRFDRNKQASSRQEAERAVHRAFELDPSLPEAHNAKARGLIAQGNYREAKEELKKALEQEPGFDAAWANLGRVHQSLAEYAAGLAALKRAIQLNPTSFRHYISLGNFHLRTEEYSQAEMAYRKAANLKPESPIAWRNLGACLLYQGEAEKAAQALLQSLGIEENARSRTNLGIAYQYLQRYDQAAEQSRRATELEPNYAAHWGTLGDALTLLGREDEAREAYQTAARCSREKVEASPLDPLAHSSLAVWCAKAGDLQSALSETDRARGMGPDNSDILFSNAVVRCIQGRDDEAFSLLEKARKLGLGRAQVEHDPALIRLHQDPRFKRILELTS